MEHDHDENSLHPVDTWAPDSEVRAARMDEGWGRHSINRVRYRHHDESIFLYAFDRIELNGDDPMQIAPICDPALTPTKCSAFISLDQAIVLYVRYPHLIRCRQAVGLSESCP